MDTATHLATRLDELSASLARAGVSGAEAQRLLGTASLATLQAVSLELLTASRQVGRPSVSVVKAEPVAEPLAPRLAA